jgi:predicted Zn-dependent peptidase
VPAKGTSAEDCEEEVLKEIEKLKNELISVEDLDKIKARAKSSFINQLSSRTGMASQLALYENLFGDWHEMFTSLEKINAVTPEDIQRVAKEIFTRENRTVSYIETIEQ